MNTTPEGILLSNGVRVKYVAGSASLGFYGTGWWWQKPLIWLGLLDPTQFVVVGKTILRRPRKFMLQNFPWFRFLQGGMVNKWSLANEGVDAFVKKAKSHLDPRIPFVASIAPTPGLMDLEAQLTEIDDTIRLLNPLPLSGISLNISCPNLDSNECVMQTLIAQISVALSASQHPLWVKLSVTQDYIRIVDEIALRWKGKAKCVEAIELNCVPATRRYPLRRFFWSGGGGVSGKPAQHENWAAAHKLQAQDQIPVIVPSAMSLEDAQFLIQSRAKAISMVALFWMRPWLPNIIVRKLEQESMTMQVVGK